MREYFKELNIKFLIKKQAIENMIIFEFFIDKQAQLKFIIFQYITTLAFNMHLFLSAFRK